MALNTREMTLIAAGAVLLAGVAGWQFAWQPLMGRHEAAENALMTMTTLSAQLDRLDEAGGPVTSSPAADTAPIFDRVSRHAEGFNLGLRQLVPEAGGLKITTKEVAFDTIIAWIAAVTQDEAVVVRSAQLVRQPKPGIVTARLEFGERP